jgi:hypothetical protein
VKLAHLADLHLGFRQYHRQTSSGINQREADVALAFRRAIDDLAAERPDAIVIAGDIFHSVRPTNAAILDAFTQLKRLRDLLPEVPVVIVAGNHDTPRSLETGSILRLFENLGISVAWDRPRRLAFERLGLSILAVPTATWLSDHIAIEPDPQSRYNVMVTHREVDGVIPETSGLREYGMAPIDVRQLHADRFDYVALGHYHVAHAVSPNAWYSGSLEYVSSNPWGELSAEPAGAPPKTPKGAKGWLAVELGERGTKPRVQFHPLALARKHFDLVPIKGATATADDLDRLIAERVAGIGGGVADQVVRQVIYDVPRLVARDVNHEQIRKLKASALHYLIDMRRPRAAEAVGVTPGARVTLADTVGDYLGRRPLDAGLNRERLVQLGRQYLAEVERELGEP